MDDPEAEDSYVAILGLLDASDAGALATEIRRVVTEGRVREEEDTEGSGRRTKKTKISVTRALTSPEKLATALRLLVSAVEPTIWQVETIATLSPSAAETFDPTQPISWIDEREGDAPQPMLVGEPLSAAQRADLGGLLSQLLHAAKTLDPDEGPE